MRILGCILILVGALPNLQGCSRPASADAPQASAPDVAVATSADAYVLADAVLAVKIAAANSGDMDAARSVADHFGEGLQNRPRDATIWALKAASMGDHKYLFVAGSMSLEAGLCEEGMRHAYQLLILGDAHWKAQMKESLDEFLAAPRHACHESILRHLAAVDAALK